MSCLLQPILPLDEPELLVVLSYVITITVYTLIRPKATSVLLGHCIGCLGSTARGVVHHFGLACSSRHMTVTVKHAPSTTSHEKVFEKPRQGHLLF